MKIKIQNVIFPKQNICEIEDMYYRKIGLPSSPEIYRDEIVFKKHQRVNFDTYFNSLSLLKWIKYTYADSNFSINLTLKGDFKVTLIHYWIEPNGTLQYQKISTENVSFSEKQEISLPYVTQNPFGMIAFSLEAKKEDSIFYGGYYSSEIDTEPQNINIGMGICTFKRESYVLNNIENLKKYIFTNPDCPVSNKLNIFISDNAHTLNESDFNCDKVHLVYNKNTGGSGGFTRTMLQAIDYNKENEAKLTHLLLTDDDIKFDPDAIIRAYTMLSILKPEFTDAFIGGAMCRMDKENIQHASGEIWHKNRCENFIETFNNNRNLINLCDIVENEYFVNSNHQAWWFCAIPMKFIREDNLSMPFFIKSDDIEFSARNMKTLILLNGINAWHESFESKYSAQNEYYTVRNYLISAAAHNSFVSKKDVINMLKSYTRHYLSNYKYLEIEHLCNAINDFLAGVDHFKSIDLEKYHKSILSKGYKTVDASELPVKFTKEQYYKDISYDKHVGKISKFLKFLTINGLLLPSKGFAVLGMWGGTNVQTYRKKFLVRYSAEKDTGFILKRSLSKAIKAFFKYRKTRKRLKRRFDKAFKEFQNRWQELVTRENWNNYLS